LIGRYRLQPDLQCAGGKFASKGDRRRLLRRLHWISSILGAAPPFSAKSPSADLVGYAEYYRFYGRCEVSFPVCANDNHRRSAAEYYFWHFPRWRVRTRALGGYADHRNAQSKKIHRLYSSL